MPNFYWIFGGLFLQFMFGYFVGYNHGHRNGIMDAIKQLEKHILNKMNGFAHYIKR